MILNATFVILLFLLAIFDFKERRLPNVLVFLLALLGLYMAWQAGDLASKILAGTIGFSLFYFIRLTYRRLRGIDGLGMGDVKLLGAAGLWVGLAGLPFVMGSDLTY